MREKVATLSKNLSRLLRSLYLRFNPAYRVKDIGWKWYDHYGRFTDQPFIGVDFGSQDQDVIVFGHQDEQGNIVIDHTSSPLE